MNQIDPEHFYSIFSEEDGVVLYDCLKHAEDAKTDWEQDTWVAGPFEHSRIEKDLVRGAQSALRVLTRVRARMNDADLAPGVDLAIRQLKDGLASYFPPE